MGAFDDDHARYRMQLRVAMQMSDPRRAVCVLGEASEALLPEPLRDRARAMREASTPDEAVAAAREFIVVSSEWT